MVMRLAKPGCLEILATGVCLALLATTTAPAMAQSAQSNGGIDSDLASPEGRNVPPPPPPPDAPYPSANTPYPPPGATYPPAAEGAPPMAAAPTAAMCGRQNDPGGYESSDLIGAAEGVFGKGARGLAEAIRGILRKQGAPDGYIAGREAGGAFIVGLRYGSGVLCQRMQEPLPVYWTGPSVGFDAGANAAKTFVLVYNLNDPNQLFKRFGAGEGQAYFVGGFNISYLRHGSVVLIPVRLGVGLRLGVNVGEMKISRRQNWVPF